MEMGVGGQVPKMFFLGVKWNVHIFTEKSSMEANPFGMVGVEGVNFQRNVFYLELNEISRL